MKQINFRKNEKITVGLILLLLCIFLAVLVPVSYTHLTLPTKA